MATHNDKYSLITGLTGIVIIAVVFPLYFKMVRKPVENTTIERLHATVKANSHKGVSIHHD